MGIASNTGRGTLVLFSLCISHSIGFPPRPQIVTDVFLDPRPEYHRVWLTPNRNYKATGASLLATSTGGQRSSRTISLAATNGLLELPALKEGDDDEIKKGSVVECVVIGELGS